MTNINRLYNFLGKFSQQFALFIRNTEPEQLQILSNPKKVTLKTTTTASIFSFYSKACLVKMEHHQNWSFKDDAFSILILKILNFWVFNYQFFQIYSNTDVIDFWVITLHKKRLLKHMIPWSHFALTQIFVERFFSSVFIACKVSTCGANVVHSCVFVEKQLRVFNESCG